MDPAKAQETLENFADYLCDRREQITQEWASAVARDGRIQTSEKLKLEDLEEYLSDVFDNLSDILRFPADHDVLDKADRNARTHGSHRFVQGYRLDELLREITRARSVSLTHVLAFEEQTPAFTGVVKRVALQRLHGFFDDLICDAAAQFVQEQQAGLYGDIAQAREGRQEAETEKRIATAESASLRDIDRSRLRLLRNVAHELNNSVNAAQLITQDLEGETHESTCRELTSMLARNIKHMGALLRDLLEYTVLLDSQKDLCTEPVLLEELNDDLCATYKALAETKGLHFENDYDPSLISVISNRIKLVQIATNLLSNAVKYTSQGRVRFWMRAGGEDQWSLGVEDTGAGIAKGERDQLFTEFHRIQETAHIQGTGLGLAIVKTLVSQLGGKILLQSELGQGSRFEVIFPRISVAEGEV